MKRFAMVFLLAVALCLAGSNSRVYANVYASQVTLTNSDGSPFDGNFSDGTAAKISFFLNDAASSVMVRIVDSATLAPVATIDAGALNAGLNAVDWDGTGALGGASYLVQITAEQPNASTTDWTIFFDSGDGPPSIFTRGVDVVKNQMDADFGLIFTANDGGPLGTGINIYNPDGTFHDPFLVAADVADGGNVTYGTMAPFFVTADYVGRRYVSLIDLGQVMRIDRDYSAKVIIDGLDAPKGLHVEGEGANLTVYVSTRTQILRAVIGTADTVAASSLEVLAQFSNFRANQIILDDDGFLYATLRNQAVEDGAKGLRKYDISGTRTLPLADDDAEWFLDETKTFIANDLVLDHGSDPGSASDDILYYCTRAGGGNNQDGIWRVDDINSFFPDTVRIITEAALYPTISDNNISFRATIDLDAAGNFIFMENANEHIFFISPPGTGATNSFATTGPDTFAVNTPVSVETAGDPLPASYRLEANYPNPFNPSTTIRYTLGGQNDVELAVYNLRGSKIRTLVSGAQTAGEHAAVWKGKNDAGKSVASGVYLVRLRAGAFSQARKITLAK